MCALPKLSFIVPNFGMRKGEMGNILAANAHALLHFGKGHWLPNEERRGSRTTNNEGRRHGRTWKEGRLNTSGAAQHTAVCQLG